MVYVRGLAMLRPIQLPVGVFVAVLLGVASAARAQSGRATFTGWVAFDGVAYVDKQPVATVEIFRAGEMSKAAATITTDEHGHYAFNGSAPLGEVVLRISAPGYVTYEIPMYVPSDFNGNLATMLKKSDGKATGTKP